MGTRPPSPIEVAAKIRQLSDDQLINIWQYAQAFLRSQLEVLSQVSAPVEEKAT